MQRVLIPGKNPETRIVVQTRLGTDLENSQSHEYSHFELAQFDEYGAAFPQVTFLNPPSPIYNCHGLVFASRRTGIHDDKALALCIAEDGYEEVRREDVTPGDIAIYYAINGDAEHSALVISAPDTELGVPKVLSKWGRFREATHWLHVCPYNAANVRFYRMSKWT